MRELKFRGKNDGLGWLYGHYYYGENFGGKHLIQVQLQDETYLSWCVEPGTLGQFTGLLDKNLNEIYEGDMLSRELDNEKFIYVVRWDEKGACFVCDNKTSFMLPTNWYKASIIGNIYDNPENGDD